MLSSVKRTCDRLSLVAHQAQRVLQFAQVTHAPDCIATALLQVRDLSFQLNSAVAPLGNLPVNFLQSAKLV